MLKGPLPLDGPFKNVWTEIQKVIDPLHIHNHKRPSCRELYPPSKVLVDYPDANLMTCEETFAWLGKGWKYEWKILCFNV